MLENLQRSLRRLRLELAGGVQHRRTARRNWEGMHKRLRQAVGRLPQLDNEVLDSPLLPFLLDNLGWKRRLPCSLAASRAADRPSGDLSFSVIVNTVNRARYLRDTLRALLQLEYSHFEVLVVVGPCEDDTAAVIDSYRDSVRLLECPDLNLARSRNIGLRHAQGDVVAFIDDDAVPRPDWLSRLAAAYRDPRVGAAGGPIHDASGVSLQCRFTLADRLGQGTAFFDQAPIGAWQEHFSRPGAYHFLTLTGTNCSFRREALLELGGFDETYAFFLEETDLCLRFIEAGWMIAHCDDAVVYHKYAPSHLRDARNVQRDFSQIYRSISYFYCRHGTAFWGAEGIRKKLDERLARHARDMRFKHADGLISDDELRRIEETTAAGVEAGRQAAKASPAVLPPLRPAAESRFRPIAKRASGRRFVLLSPTYFPDTGSGIAVYTRALANGLVELGHEVLVLAKVSSGGERLDYQAGVWVHRVKPLETNALPELPPGFPLPRSHRAVAAALHARVVELGRERPLTGVLGPIWNFPGLYCDLDPAIPFFTSIHTPYLIAQRYKDGWRDRRGRLNATVEGLIACERAFFEAKRPFIANSRAILDALENELGIKLDGPVIPHGLPPLPSEQQRDLRDPDRFTALCVGRWEHRKGVDRVFAVLPEIMTASPRLHLRFIGDMQPEGELPPWLVEARNRHGDADWWQRLELSGEVSEPELLDAYQAADAVLCPSRFESFGLTVLEAMRAGRPVIGFNGSGGVEELIREGGVCLKDEERLAPELRRMVNESERVRSTGRGLQARFLEHYTQASMARAVAESCYPAETAAKTSP